MIEEMTSLVVAPYFHTYLKLVEIPYLPSELAASQELVEDFLNDLPEEKLDHRYAEDKWSVAEVIQHCIETEIIFCFRALTIARESEIVNLKGFNEDDYAKASAKQHWKKSEILIYFDAVRTMTNCLLNTMSSEQLKKVGVASDNEIQVEALFFVTSAHYRHHLNVLNERYL